MAVQAAHFTSTSQVKPSIFEIIAQNSLNDTLSPAVEKLFMVLATNFPSKFQWMCDNHDEVFFILNGILQSHYITKYGASFAENFYSLQRIPIDANKTLSNYDKSVSLIMLLVLPYLRRKLEDRIAVYRLQKAEGSLRSDIEGRLKRLFIGAHSVCHLLWGTWTTINYLRYMSNETSSQLPLLNIIGLKLVYAGNEDNPGFWSALFRGQLSFPEITTGIVKNILTAALEITAFTLQFLQAWNAEKPNYNLASLPIVPPPSLDNRAKDYKGKCPICLQMWKIPTVLPVSGYVFCFPCILRQLRESQRCPVTNLPAKPLDIIRLYDN